MSKSKDGNAVEGVLKYLIGQNRPYSVNDVVQNLHKEFGKTAVQKAVDVLVMVRS
jgi:26S proteasome regulatory subunit (ATPase 3-interacting protein)